MDAAAAKIDGFRAATFPLDDDGAVIDDDDVGKLARRASRSNSVCNFRPTLSGDRDVDDDRVSFMLSVDGGTCCINNDDDDDVGGGVGLFIVPPSQLSVG